MGVQVETCVVPSSGWPSRNSRSSYGGTGGTSSIFSLCLSHTVHPSIFPFLCLHVYLCVSLIIAPMYGWSTNEFGKLQSLSRAYAVVPCFII